MSVGAVKGDLLLRSRTVVTLLSAALVVAAFAALGASDPAGAQQAQGAAPPSAVGDPVPSAGCGSSVVAPGQQQVFLTSGGEQRWYLRRVPPAHDGATPVPVVFDYHGLAEGAQIHTGHSQFGPYGDERGFVTIFPQGRGTGLNVSWDTSLGGVDVAMFGDVLDQVEADLCIDTNRVFVTGLSLGGFMTSSIACVYADRVAAVAPVAGLRNPTGCNPSRPIPIRTFHGTEDTWVSYPPIPGNAAAWAARNGCAATPPSEVHVGSDDVAQVDLLSHECPVDAPVELYRITGGGHSWPGSEFSRSIASAVGYTTFVISATERAWDFFESHPLDGVTYNARYEAKWDDRFTRLAAGLGLSSVEELVSLGVTGFRGMAEQGTATPVASPPVNEGPFQVDITYTVEEAEAIEAAAEAWGVTGDQLHHLGGILVAVLIYLAIVASR
jgi:polyhydroxybutyrate depolymerase